MALRVDFSKQIRVKDRLSELLRQQQQPQNRLSGRTSIARSAVRYGSVCQAIPEDRENIDFDDVNGCSWSDHYRDQDQQGRASDKSADTSATDSRRDETLWSRCSVTLQDIYSAYPDNTARANKVIFVLKLCLSQLAYGQCTVDAEQHARNVAIALGLGHPRLELGPRTMTASFSGSGRVYFIETHRNLIMSKLADVTELAILVANGFTDDATVANQLLDEIMAAPLPYGWLVESLLYWALSTLAAVCAFFGSYYDMFVVAGISFVVAVLQQLEANFPPQYLAHIDLLLVSVVVGMCSSFAFRFLLFNVHDGDLCHVSVLFLSPLLVYLPGSDLVYGVYEIKLGKSIVGASRLVTALVRCMFMASGLTIGWQVFGHGLVLQAGGIAKASFVPSQRCPPFALDVISLDNVGPWWLVFAVYNIFLLVPLLASLQVPAHHFLGSYLVAYPSLLVFGFLNFGCDEPSCGLPSYLANVIGLFVAGSLASLREYLTGVPAVTALIPVLLVLAPGSDAVVDILKLMQVNNGVDWQIGGTPTDAFVSLTLLAVSYALGLVLALVIWTPLLDRKRASPKVRNSLRQEDLRMSVRASIVAPFGPDKF